MLLFLVLFVVLTSFLVKGYFSENVSEYVKYDCTNKINAIIISSINKNVVEELSEESLMKVTYNDENEVVYAYIDTKKTNEILGLAGVEIINLTNVFNNNSQNTIDIPLGYLFSESVFFGNTFTVPVNVSSVTSYSVKLDTKVQEYGINASLVNVNLVYEFSFKTMIPLISKDVYVTNEVPLVSTVLYGEVPNYFFSGEKPNISIS